MSVGYQLAYRVGLTPWERAGEEAPEAFTRLLAREEEGRTPPWGRALDLGCGTGAHTVELAQRGWTAVGYDNVSRAVEAARTKPGAEAVQFVDGDVTDLAGSGIAGEFELFLDVGCFHGLTDEQRAAYGAGVTSLATSTATLLLLAFVPGRRPVLPRGADRSDLERALPGWTVLDVEAADTTGMRGPLKRTAPQWFRLGRR
ncbi:MAG: class I SAM-dependent methyltransferase [Marmoricola sp.]|nr:class I SAM-dependent methyltransferase [Marmoricola sp.]